MLILNMADHLLLRECYLETNQTPTISVMNKYMKPILPNVYFKTMGPKHKLIAGLEPPLKGGGNSWYVSPKDLLEGRAVMKPLNIKYLAQLGWCGLDEIAMRLMVAYRSQMASESVQALHDNDAHCKLNIYRSSLEHWQKCAEKEKNAITARMRVAFSEFTGLYTSSLNKLEVVLADAAIKKIKETESKAYQKMQAKYEVLVQMQAAKISDRYTKKLEEEKLKLKTSFIDILEKRRTAVYNKLHDINLEKHIAVEKLRHFQECEKIGCQIYVALKEQQECVQEMLSAEYKHSKKYKILTKKIAMTNIKIRHAQESERKNDELNKIWRKKVCSVVKKFQLFVSYCLKLLPEQADFFINMEKLMLIQLSEVLEKPSAYSIFESDFEQIYTPRAKPHPFYLFCDKNYKPKLDQNLCPRHCTSSASQLPVIVINKRCIYGACDNFQQLSDKLKDWINGDIHSEADFEDDYDYGLSYPFKFSSSQQLQELKLEGSLMQVLEQEIANIQEVSFACPGCKIPHCYECHLIASPKSTSLKEGNENDSRSSLQSISSAYSSRQEMTSLKESNWENYQKYIEPKKCDCSKMAKKHLLEHLPAYMRKVSYYDAPVLVNYEPCSVTALKALVEKTRGKKCIIPPPRKLSRSKEMATQYVEPEFENLSACFCNDDMDISILSLTRRTISGTTKINHLKVVGDSQSSTFLTKNSQSFIRERTLSLRRLMQSSEVEELFKRTDCNF